MPTEHVTVTPAFERYLADEASLLVREAGPDMRLLAHVWSAFLDGEAAAQRGQTSGKASEAPREPFSALQAVALAPAFVESVRALERPDEPGPAMFAAAMAADFALWCAENELIPQSMAIRRSEEAEQAARRLGRAMRDGAVRGGVDTPSGLSPVAQAPQPTSGDAGYARLRLVPDARAAGASEGRIARLTVTLIGTEPAVWRQIEVPAGSTFAQLHTFLNTAMGWEDYHLHEFRFGGRLVAGPELDDGTYADIEDEQELALADALADGQRELLYTYDFGDGWRHRVRVDAIEDAEEGVFYPRCIDGARACPPEDVGGIHGYALSLEAIADPRHPEHEEQTHWYEAVCGSGAFDPDAFDVEAVSRLLCIAAAGDLAAEDLNFFDAV